MTFKIAGIVAAALFAAGVSAQGQTYPTREIRLVVGLPAGSGGDVVARYYADKLSQLAGKPVIVENKPGMILSLGADMVAKAPPDGYTVLITSVTSSHAANVFNFKKLPYDPIKDFTPVATLQKSYFMLMTRAGAPWMNVAELTEAMKIKGDKASYGYGAPPALASAELYKARIPGVDLPTMAEAAGIPEFDIAPLWGVLLPAGAPPAIVARLESWFAQISQMDATRQYLANTHAAPFPGGAKDLAAFIPKEIKKWEELARLAKIVPQ